MGLNPAEQYLDVPECGWLGFKVQISWHEPCVSTIHPHCIRLYGGHDERACITLFQRASGFENPIG